MELFIYLLNNNRVINSMIKKSLIKYFIYPENDFSKYNIESIIYFINHLETDDNIIIEIFLNEINNYIFSEKDFFSIEENDRYNLFKILCLNKKKFILNKSGDYLTNLKYICETLIAKLKNLDLIFHEISIYFTNSLDNFLLKRIQFLLFGLSKDEKMGDDIIHESNQIYDKLKEQIFIIKNHVRELGETSDYLEDFFSQNREKMKLKDEINILCSKIFQKKIKDIANSDEIKKKINGYQNLIKDAKKNIEKKKNSLLFREIYNSNKKKIKDQIYLLDQTCEMFFLAMEIIKEEPEKIQNNKFINFFYEIGYKDEDNLDKEIDWLINYGKIKIGEDKKMKLLTSLKLLIKKTNIINIIKGILILKDIYEDNLNQTEEEKFYFDELKNKSYLLTKKNISPKEIKEIINFIRAKFKEITFENNDINFKKKILVFFNLFNTNKESFYFFKEKKIENIEHLKEFLLDSDEKEISLYDIDEFFRVVKFLNEDICHLKSSFELIQTFISGILNPNKIQCYLGIVNKYNKFKSLFDQFLKGEGGVFTKIRDIMNHSYFSINLSEVENKYQIEGFYFKNNLNNKEHEKEIIITINSIILEELYQKMFIQINRTRNEIHIRKFIQFYKDIKELNYIINRIYFIYGYPEKIFIEFNIIKMEIEYIYKGNKYSSEDLILKFKVIKNQCKKVFNEYMPISDEIRFFYGRQLYLINKYMIEKKYEKIKDLISCATNGLIKKFNNNFNRDNYFKLDIYAIMIQNIIKYIREQLNLNNKKIEDIYLTNEISIKGNNKNQNSNKYEKDYIYKGFYFFGYSLEEYDIWNIFINLTGNPPSNSNLLLCNKETTLEEINIFFLRAIYCKFNSLFIIAIPEDINNSQKSYVLKMLKKKAK